MPLLGDLKPKPKAKPPTKRIHAKDCERSNPTASALTSALSTLVGLQFGFRV